MCSPSTRDWSMPSSRNLVMRHVHQSDSRVSTFVKFSSTRYFAQPHKKLLYWDPNEHYLEQVAKSIDYALMCPLVPEYLDPQHEGSYRGVIECHFSLCRTHAQRMFRQRKIEQFILDVIRVTWEADERSDDSVMSYLLGETTGHETIYLLSD